MSACINDSQAFQLGFILSLAFNDLLSPVIRAVRGFTHFTMKKHILLLCMYNSSQWHWRICIHCQVNATCLQVFGNLGTFLERLCLCSLQCVSSFFSRTTVVNSLTKVRVKSWGLILLLWKLATSVIRSVSQPIFVTSECLFALILLLNNLFCCFNIGQVKKNIWLMITSFKRKLNMLKMVGSVVLLEWVMLNSNPISCECASLVHMCSSADSVHHTAADRHAEQALYIYWLAACPSGMKTNHLGAWPFLTLYTEEAKLWQLMLNSYSQL